MHMPHWAKSSLLCQTWCGAQSCEPWEASHMFDAIGWQAHSVVCFCTYMVEWIPGSQPMWHSTLYGYGAPSDFRPFDKRALSCATSVFLALDLSCFRLKDELSDRHYSILKTALHFQYLSYYGIAMCQISFSLVIVISQEVCFLIKICLYES